MKISFDPNKRLRTLQERGLDFARAGAVFAGHHFTREDLRQAYPERRFVTAGRLHGRMVVLVWTLRAGETRIISMRRANEREQAAYSQLLD